MIIRFQVKETTEVETTNSIVFYNSYSVEFSKQFKYTKHLHKLLCRKQIISGMKEEYSKENRNRWNLANIQTLSYVTHGWELKRTPMINKTCLSCYFSTSLHFTHTTQWTIENLEGQMLFPQNSDNFRVWNSDKQHCFTWHLIAFILNNTNSWRKRVKFASKHNSSRRRWWWWDNNKYRLCFYLHKSHHLPY